MTKKPRTVLAIESSCDETAAAVTRGFEVLGECVATQANLHARYGGVVPEIASRQHLAVIDRVIDDALAQAGISELRELDAVAVTQGPGLIGALLVGVAAASARAWASDLPIIGVDHLLGHISSAMLDPDVDIEPPFLCVLASGGHTLLLDVDESWNVSLLGSTRDDAAGEAFDKGARLLGLGMPGGPSLAALAKTGDASVHPFTPAMLHHESLDTSFSGIKTALSVALRSRAERREGPSDADLAAAYEAAIVATIVGSVRKLIKRRGPGSGHPQAREQLALVGGVAANELLRSELAEICSKNRIKCARTPLRWCGDNAVMIGVAASLYSEQAHQNAGSLEAYATSSLLSKRQLVPS